jgi:hypothetical protein
VEELDLLDQELDCLAGGSDLLALVRRQPRSPGTQDADLLFVKPFRMQTSAVGESLELIAARSRVTVSLLRGLVRWRHSRPQLLSYALATVAEPRSRTRCSA